MAVKIIDTNALLFFWLDLKNKFADKVDKETGKSLLSDDKYAESLLVLDRSSYSNAVTIGYGLSLLESWDSDVIDGYVDRAMD